MYTSVPAPPKNTAMHKKYTGSTPSAVPGVASLAWFAPVEPVPTLIILPVAFSTTVPSALVTVPSPLSVSPPLGVTGLGSGVGVGVGLGSGGSGSGLGPITINGLPLFLAYVSAAESAYPYIVIEEGIAPESIDVTVAGIVTASS